MERYWAVSRDEGLSICCSVGEPGECHQCKKPAAKAVYSTVPFI